MKRLLTGIATAALCAAVVSPALADLKVGDPMPALKVGGVYNNEFDVNLNNVEGHIVVVEFWATWCGPCKAQIPHLNKLHKEYKDKGVLLVSISNESDALVEPFVKQMNMEYLVASNSKIGQEFGVTGIPAAFLFGPDGKLIWDGHPAELDSHLAAAVKKYPDARALGGGPEYNERLFGEVEAALVKGDTASAVKRFGRVDLKSLDAQEGHRARYNGIVNRITPMAEGQYDRAKAAIAAGEYASAGKILKEVSTNFRGLPIADKAAKELKALESNEKYIASKRNDAIEGRASNMLTRAKASAEKGDHVLAYKKMLVIVEKFGDTEAAAEAKKLIAQYEADAEFMKQIDG